MTLEHLLLTIFFGGLMGLIGQGVRSTVGFKKLHDGVAEKRSTFSSEFSTSGFFTSLLLGFIAGAIAILILDISVIETVEKNKMKVQEVNQQALFGLMAVGYSATDFIEGFAKRLLPYQKAMGSLKE